MAKRSIIPAVILCLFASGCLSSLIAQQPLAPQALYTKEQAVKAAAIKQQAAKTSETAKAAEIARTQPAPPPLQIVLSATPTPLYAGQPLRLIVTPNHPTSAAAYFFEWGDHTEDTASREPQAAHTYVSAGTYPVSVHARAAVDGRAAQPAEANITLVVDAPPPAKAGGNPAPPVVKKPIPLRITLTCEPPAPVAGQTVRIIATPSYPISYARYSFDWGDKTPPTLTSEPQAPHVYTSASLDNISVQVRALAAANDAPANANATLRLAVDSPPPPPPPPQNPTLTLTASQTHALPGRPITFTVASDPPTGFTQFQYHFGDTNGPAQLGPNGVQYAYTRPGIYYATASTLSADGQTTLTSPEVQVRITPAPLPELVLNLLTPNPVVSGATVVSASLDPSEPDESYRFDWGDNTQADTVNDIGRAPHTYAKPGTYILSVVAVTAAGNIPGQKTIVVVIPPRAPIPVYPILFAILAAGVLAYWAYHHFHAPAGELHSTFGVNRSAGSNINIPADAPYLSLTFNSGADAPDHRITFL